MSHIPVTNAQVIKLLSDLRARRQDPQSPLLFLALVSRESRRQHLAESPAGRWMALTMLVGTLILDKAAQALDLPPQKLHIVAEKAGEELFALLRKAYDHYGHDPRRLGWAYLYLRFIASCRLQHQELERRVRGAAGSLDTNAFWNSLKNKVAGPALVDALNQLESEEQVRLGPRPFTVSSLPAPESGLIGRQHTRERATDALRAGPLVTLTGPGGIGKTSLALQLAWDLVGAFPDGACWLDLSRVADPAQLLPSLWQELSQGEPMTADPAAALVALLRGRRLLLVLDNCEHLLPGASDLVLGLLQAGPDLRILATSRRPLKLDQERVFRLRGFAVPPEGETNDLAAYEAVRAFAAEVKRHRPDMDVTTEATAPVVAAIVRRVEGLPLALKLIAPWTRQLSLTELLDNLDALLARGADQDRNLLERHRTLDTCLAWSLDRMEPAQREVFIQLAVFRGGWTTPAVAAICLPSGGALDAMSSIEMLLRLVDLSLVEVDSSGAHSRGHLLEPIRGQCLALLNAEGTGEVLRARHAAWYLALAERAVAERERLGEAAWLATLDEEQPNLRAAAIWARDAGQVETELRLATAVWRHDLRRGYGAEAKAALSWGLTHPTRAELAPEVQARAMNAAAGLALLTDDEEAALMYLQGAADLLKDGGLPQLRMSVLHNLGNLRMVRHDHAGAGHYYQEALAQTEAGTERIRATIERNLALLAFVRSDTRVALDWLGRAETYYLRTKDLYELALCLQIRGQAECRLGRGALGHRALTDAAAQFQTSDDLRRELETRLFLADMALNDLDLAAATTALQRATVLDARADDPAHSAMLSILFARRDLLAGDSPGAAERLRRLRMTLADSLDPSYPAMVDVEHAWALVTLGMREEAARLAQRVVASDRRQAFFPVYDVLVTLEAVARITTDERGPLWLAEIARIRAWAGLPRTALQAARCGAAAPGNAAGKGADEGADWRAALNELREVVTRALEEAP